MKTTCLFVLLIGAFAAFAADSPPSAAPAAQPAAAPAPPPAAPAKRSMADLEKLVAPIALYPDPLLATVLPASVYPLEIVQAARFVADTNNLAKLDEQPWDENVKAVARAPEAIKKLNEDISWTMELGEAFLAQDKDIMDAIQSMRGKAQKAGTLQTSPQQVVTVTNMIVEKTVEEKVVVVTNTVVQIQPSSTTTVYVPTYNPTAVYYPPPAYYANPYPLLTFGAGMAAGAIIANNCNWNNGGCYNNNVNVDIDRNVNRNTDRNTTRNTDRAGQTGARGASASGQKWQPDQSRLSKSGSPAASTRSAESRGYGSAGAKPSTGNVGARPSTGTAGARPSAGNAAAARPSTGNAGAARPSAGTAPASRPSASPSASRPSPSASPSASRSSSSGSAFGGASSGSSARASSNRGSSSRSGGGGGGGGRSGGGGGRR